MRKVFFSFVAVVMAVFTSQGCATTGGLLPGYEVNRVVAANQAMVWTLRNSMYGPGLRYPQVGYFVTPTGQRVECRPKPREHQIKDVVGATLAGLGIGGFSGGARGATYGATAGAGGGLLYSNHEYDCYIVQPTPSQPSPAPPPQPPPVPPQPSLPAPPAPPSLPSPPEPVLEPIPPRLAGVEFTVVNGSPWVIVVQHDNRRTILKQRTQVSVSTPDVRIFIIQQDGKGFFDEFELDLRGTEDSTLPGWKIGASVRLKGP